MQKKQRYKSYIQSSMIIVLFICLILPAPNMIAVIEDHVSFQNTQTMQLDYPQELLITTLADGSSEKDLIFYEAGELIEYVSIPKNATIESATMNLTGRAYTEEIVLFSDDFDDGDIGDWTVTEENGGIFEPSTEKFVSSPYSVHMKALIRYQRAMGVSPTYPYDLNLSEDYNATFNFLVPHSTNHWYEIFNNNQTYLILQSGTTLGWYDGSSPHSIMLLNQSQWYPFKIVVHQSSNNYDVYVDSQKVATCSMWIHGSYNNCFRIGERSDDSQYFDYGEAYWDDFVITQGSNHYYPLNPSLDVGEDGDMQWTYIGNFDTTETIPDFTDELNEYLDVCDPPGENCLVPLVFSSDSGGILNISNILISYTLPPENTPPNAPDTPSGSTSLIAGKEYMFSTSTTDPEEDQLYYQWDWGNEYSQWMGPFDSGEIVDMNHRWRDQGTFPIRVRAKDVFEAVSDWSDCLIVEVASASSNWKGNTPITSSSASSESPSFALDSQGNIHICWHDYRDDTWEIYYKKLDHLGNEVITDTRLTEQGASKHPSLAIDSNDAIHIIWQDDRDGNWEIYYTKLNNEGSVIVDDLRLTSDGASSQYPCLSISNEDSLHCTWQDNRFGTTEILYKKLNSSGSILIDDTLISSMPNESIQPSLTADNDTIVYLVWSESVNETHDLHFDEAYGDLYPSSIAYTSTDPDPSKIFLPQTGVILHFEVLIENGGDLPILDAPVDITANGELIWSGSISVAGKSSEPVTFDWSPPSQGSFVVMVSIYPDATIVEYDSSNNQLFSSLIAVDPGNVEETLFIDGYQHYQDEFLACNQLYLEGSGELVLENTTLLFYGPASELMVHGYGIHALSSTITSVHPSQPLMFEIHPGVQQVELVDCDISYLMGTGFTLHGTIPSFTFVGNTLSHCEGEAITIMGSGTYEISESSIYDSGIWDFDINNCQVQVTNSHFDLNKIQVGPSATFHYYKDVQVSFEDEHEHPASNAYYEVRDAFGSLIDSGYTDEQGRITVLNLHVFQQTYGSTDLFTPFNFTAQNLSSSAFGSFYVNPDGLFHGGFGGFFGGNFNLVTRTKYAILVAGWDNANQHVGTTGEDRYAYWNDIEYMYHMLTSVKGYRQENIQVVFMNGTDDDFDQNEKVPINYSANISNIEKAFKYIGGKIKNDAGHKDTLFIFTADHGNQRSGFANSALIMADGSNYNDSEFAQMLDTTIGTNASRIIIVMDQCHGGGFINDLKGQNRAVITATRPGQSSWWYCDPNDNTPEDGHSFFMVEFISAFHNHTDAAGGGYPDDDLTNYNQVHKETTDRWLRDGNAEANYHVPPLKQLDDDEDGKISLFEAFDYALDNDLCGPVDRRTRQSHGSEDPRMVDDDVVIISSINGYIHIYRYDGYGTLSGEELQPDYPSGIFKDILTYDLDNDNDDDIVVVEQSRDEIKVLLNDGNWSFETRNYAVGDSPYSLTINDFNDDEYLDVAITNQYDDDITVLLNFGNGTFDAENRTDYNVGNYCEYIDSSDLDNDQDIDLVITNRYDYSISTLLNTGDGTFSSLSNYSIGYIPTDVTLGDIDNDSDIDMITTAYPNKVITLTNQQYQQRTIWDYVSGVHDVTSTDIDQDTDIDLIAVSATDDVVFWFENTKQPEFPWAPHLIGTMDMPWSVSTNDIDGDGDDDVIVGSSSYDNIRWFENDIQNESWIEHEIQNTSYGALSVCTIDMNYDNDIDIVASISPDGRVAWYENTGKGTSWIEHNITEEFYNPKAVFAIDMDGDTDVDVVASASYNNLLVWFEKKTAGWDSHVISGSVNEIISLYIDDIDGDSDLDIAAANSYENQIAWFEHNGSSWDEHVLTNTAYYASSVYIIDMDNDSDVDICYSSVNDNTIGWFENDGLQTPSWKEHIIVTNASGAADAHPVDIDNDTDIDVAGALYQSQSFRLYERVPVRFYESKSYTVGDSPEQVRLVELTYDGHEDMVVLNRDSNNFTVFEADGAGDFTNRGSFGTQYVISHGPWNFYVNDLDSDGDYDIIIPSQTPSALWTFINQDVNKEGTMRFSLLHEQYLDGYWLYAIHGTEHDKPRRWFL